MFSACAPSVQQENNPYEPDFASPKNNPNQYQNNLNLLGGQQAYGYIFGTRDIPLISGLEIVDEESTNFDTTAGTITVAVYTGYLSLGEIKKFYSITLPQLGYKVQADNGDNIIFNRSGDMIDMTIDRDQSSGKTSVKFIISAH